MANTFDIVASLGVLRRYENGWTRELNLVSWDGKDPKFDVRDWSPDHLHPARGISVAESTMKEFARCYKQWKATGNTVFKTAAKKPKYIRDESVISVTIHGYIGTITSINRYGWRTEANVVSWNRGEPKVDIREWSEDHNRMSRGITLTEEEADLLIHLFEEKKAA